MQEKTLDEIKRFDEMRAEVRRKLDEARKKAEECQKQVDCLAANEEHMAKRWKSLGDAIADGEAIEAGVPLKADEYDVKLEQRKDGTYFIIKRRGKDGE